MDRYACRWLYNWEIARLRRVSSVDTKSRLVVINRVSAGLSFLVLVSERSLIGELPLLICMTSNWRITAVNLYDVVSSSEAAKTRCR